MPITTVISTAIGASDTIINNGGGQFNDTNTIAQLGATAAGLGNAVNPLMASTAMNASIAAMSTGLAAFAMDLQNGSRAADVISDGLQVIGDATIFAGAALSYLSPVVPGAQVAAATIEEAGNGITLAGAGIKNWDAIVANTPVAIGELATELNEGSFSFQSSLPTLAGMFNNAGTSIGAAWTQASNAFTSAFSAINTAVGAVGTSTFNATATAASNALSTVESKLADLFTAIGAPLQNTTQTVTNNSFTITSSNSSVPTTTGNATFGSNGSSLGLTTTGNNGSLNYNETNSVGSTSVGDAVQNNNSSGTPYYTQTITTQSNGFISATITGTGDTTFLSHASITLSAGAQAIIDGVQDQISAPADTISLGLGTWGNMIYGNQVTINGANGVDFGLTGSNGILNAIAASVFLNPGGSGNHINGNQNSVTATSNSVVLNAGTWGNMFYGNGNTITAAANGIDFGVTGNNSTLNSSNASIFFNPGDTGNSVLGAYNSITGHDIGFTIGGGGSSILDYLTGANQSVTLLSGANAALASSYSTGSVLNATSHYSGETVSLSETVGSNHTLSFQDNASGTGANTYNFSGSMQLAGVDHDTFVNAGTFSLSTADLLAGYGSGSVSDIFNPVNSLMPIPNVIEQTSAAYSGAGATGQLQGAAIGLAPISLGGSGTISGLQTSDYFNYNGTPNIYTFQETWNIPAPNGQPMWANFTAAGVYLNGNEGGVLQNSGYLGNGGELEVVEVTDSTGKAVAPNREQFLAALPANNDAAARAAQMAFDENAVLALPLPDAKLNANLALVTSSDPDARSAGLLASSAPVEGQYEQALYEGAKWDKTQPITWSLATSAGTEDSPFSGYMDKQYEALVQRAFDAWAKASGLTLQQVDDSGKSDIRIGWGAFNTKASGVIGYTTYQNNGGAFDPGVTIRLEDPTQNALKANADGSLTYTGTNADLYQVILHEVGHALGLADNADSKSVMYYKATGANNTLDDNDIAGMQVLYGDSKPSLAVQAIQGLATELSGAKVNSMLEQFQAAAADARQASGASATPDAVQSKEAPNVVADTSAHLNGTTIQNFSALDRIDLTDMAFGANTTLGFREAASGTAGTLSLSDGTHNAAILLMGQYTAASFQTASDGGAGTLVTLASMPNPTATLAAAHA